MLEGSYTGIPWVLQGYYKSNIRMLPGCQKDVIMVLLCFKNVLQRFFIDVSMKFFKGVTRGSFMCHRGSLGHQKVVTRVFQWSGI